MAGYPGEMSEPDPGVRTRPRRSVLPWILTFASLTFALGLLANPWFEREIRSRLPFGGGNQVADAPQAGAREASTPLAAEDRRSEEHTSELQSLMRSSYAVFCLKKTNNNTRQYHELKNQSHN